MTTATIVTLLVAVAGMQSASSAQKPAQAPSPGKPAPEHLLAATAKELVVREGLAVGLVGSYARSAVPTDLLAWQLATGAFVEPREGTLLNPDDKTRPQAWTRVSGRRRRLDPEPGAQRGLAPRRGELASAPGRWCSTPRATTSSRVNGEPRGGEKYGMDWVRHPVRLNKGRNTLLFQGERGRIRARLFDPPAPVFFADNDNTLPDIVIGENRALWAGVRLVNTTEDTIDAVEIAYSAGERRGTAVVRATIPPLTTRKLPISDRAAGRGFRRGLSS